MVEWLKWLTSVLLVIRSYLRVGARHSQATWTSQVLLVGVSGVFPGVLPFPPTYRSIRLNTSETAWGRKTE